jgi:hypothetical protein
MVKKQMTTKKRAASTKAKTFAGIYDGKNFLFEKSLILPPLTRVRLKLDQPHNGKNGSIQLGAVVQPQIESDKRAALAPLTTMSEREIEKAVRRMARTYFEKEKSIDRIIWFKNTRGEERIHLIAVNRDTFPAGSVMAFYFRENERFPLPRRLADVTPEEWAKIRAGKIPLPQGWSMQNAVEFDRETMLAQGG